MFEFSLLFPEKMDHKVTRYCMSQDLYKDLNLGILLKAMSQGDEVIYNSCANILLSPLQDQKQIEYRQQMVNDAIQNTPFYTGAYEIAEKICKEMEKQHSHIQRKEQNQSQQIYDAINILKLQAKYLSELKSHFKSDYAEKAEGMLRFTNKLRKTYSDDFVKDLMEMTNDMESVMRRGRLFISLQLVAGAKFGNVSINGFEHFDYKSLHIVKRFIRWIKIHFLLPGAICLDTTEIEYDARQMELQSIKHIYEMLRVVIFNLNSFFEQFRSQMGFYIGCIKLHKEIEKFNGEICFPQILMDCRKNKAKKLYDLGLALQMNEKPISNDLDGVGKLYIISGANQGGKSTFLRSIGVAQVMMQAGMFVPAAYFEGHIFDHIFTHFSRREDVAMNSGRLDEEMKRVNNIIDQITSNSLVLFNEPFASTTEVEGSMIAENIIMALHDYGIQVFIVTHLFLFASSMYEKEIEHVIFLSAERQSDGLRTFKMVQQRPEETSFGLDLYDQIIKRG